MGRLINIGTGGSEGGGAAGLVAYSAARQAVAGAAAALRVELGPLGVRVITLDTDIPASERLFLRPRLPPSDNGSTERYLKCCVQAVSNHSLSVVEEALLSPTPKPAYSLAPPGGISNYVSAITERFVSGQCKKRTQDIVP
ncbi:hypothetical protein J6590_025378 [Homalodisca vitripennis]|nr:hypothetical protein J6590_025378 [Homalodisca vitripennis]